MGLMWLRAALAVLLPALVAAATAGARPLPPPVHVRAEPEGVTLGDPAFEPLSGARSCARVG